MKAMIAACLMILSLSWNAEAQSPVPEQTVAEQPVPEQYDALMESGEQSDLRGKTKKAANKYQAAVAAAASPDQRATARLKYAEAIRGSQLNAKLAPRDAADVETAFKAAVSEAGGAVSFKAHNDYGLFLLERGDAAAAVKAFAEGEKDLDAMPKPSAARYLYNFGLAKVRNGQPDEAFVTYRRALDNDAALTPAADALISIAKGFEPAHGASEAVSVVDLLVERGQYLPAEKYMQSCFENESWLPQADAMSRLLDSFTSWFVHSGFPYDVEAAEWRPILDKAREKMTSPAKEKAQQLALILGTEEISASPGANAQVYFSEWTKPNERVALSRLLKLSADAILATQQPKTASQRYVAAWQLDSKNVDALTYLAELLTSWHDPWADNFLNQLVDTLFDAKASLIEQDDLSALLRLHLILGEVFERKEAWAPAGDPRTATFQYLHALNAYESLKAKDPKTASYPGVHASAATAYQHLADKERAWQQFVAAADESVAIGQIDAAQKMLQQADELGYDATDQEKANMQRVRESVAALAKTKSAA
jgi:hypothetical protein